MDSLATALNEITLVLFTTLAPAGAVAYVLMALPLIARGDAMEPAARQKLDRFLCVPIFVAMIGLIASATHLGTPSNALYVVTGFGRSPLSNEVVCGAVFLGAAGIFWLTAFSEGTAHLTARRIAAAVISLLGLGFVAAISLAYDASTIITWNTPYTPIATWLNALTGGPLLALLGLRLARFYTPGHALGRAFIIIAIVALMASIVAYVLWAFLLPELRNALATGAEQAPLFGPSIVLFALLGASAIAFGARTITWEGETPIRFPLAATLLMLAGIFLMRFQFYMIHLTVGL